MHVLIARRPRPRLHRARHARLRAVGRARARVDAGVAAKITGLRRTRCVAFARRYGASARTFCGSGSALSRHETGMTVRHARVLPRFTARTRSHGGALLSSTQGVPRSTSTRSSESTSCRNRRADHQHDPTRPRADGSRDDPPGARALRVPTAAGSQSSWLNPFARERLLQPQSYT